MLREFLARQLRIGLKCLLLSQLLFHGFCLGAISTTEVVGDREKILYALATEGQISETLISEFYQYALKKAKEKIQAPDEFWDWLVKTQEIQLGLLVGLHPDYNPHVITNLQELRDTFGGKVEQYPHLALAFSFVYGAAKGKPIRSPGLQSWAAKNRELPSCSESFAYYIDNKNRLLFPLDQLPWPLMIYIADNDVPLSERQWVLTRYAGRSFESLGRLHNEIKHVPGANIKRRAGLPGAPMALPRIMSDGGVCSQQAYYASRVIKCLGVPSIRITAPGHAYEGWVVNDRKLKVVIGTNVGRRNGDFFCPLTRTKRKEYYFKLLVSSIDLSYDQYLKSHIACHVFNMLPDEAKKQAMGLLDASIRTNYYVVTSWLACAQACAEGIFPLEAGWKLFDRANNLLPNHPELSCTILNKLTTAQLKSDAAIMEDQFRQTRKRFEKMFARLRETKRLDLGLGIFKTQASYLAKTKGVQAVVANSLTWFTLKSFALDDEKSLFKHVLNIAIKSKNEEALEKLFRTEYHRRKQSTLKSSETLYKKHYSGYAQVANAYIAYLKKAGNYLKASEISLELDRLKIENRNQGDLQNVFTPGRPFGAIDEQVTKINPKAQGCCVWRILYDLPKGVNIRVRLKHAAAGKEGAFYFTAWSDKDRNGVPDTKIALSPLMTAENKDDWSDWEFESTDKTVFIGFATKTKVPMYYQMGGQLEGFYGLSDRVFYSGAFEGKPESCVQPRYANLRVGISRK